MTEIQQIRNRAQRHGLALRKDRRTGLYYLVDRQKNCVAAPGPMTVEHVIQWLDDLDKLAGQEGKA